MNYDRPDLADRIAADYVVGLLRHHGRARFERLAAASPVLRQARLRWEDRLAPLSLQLAPVTPSASVWPQIRRQIAAPADTTSNRLIARGRAGRRWWPAAVAAGLIAALIVVGRLTIWSEPTWQPVAVLAQANTAPQWRVERSADSAQINIRALAPVTLSATQSYELWVLPVGTGHPVSLGLLPRQGRLARRLNAAQRELLLAAMQVAVSVEPRGGSPTGLPTGPVVIVASIARST